jgi:peptidoglycan/LPS O-acetylase OafA/YrhL
LLAALLVICGLAQGNIGGFPFLMIHPTMALLLASLVIREDHVARKFLAFPPIARLGVIYGLYLYHLWGIHVVGECFERMGFHDQLAFYLAAILASVLIAEVSFRVIETPLLRLKHRFGSV